MPEKPDQTIERDKTLPSDGDRVMQAAQEAAHRLLTNDAYIANQRNQSATDRANESPSPSPFGFHNPFLKTEPPGLTAQSLAQSTANLGKDIDSLKKSCDDSSKSLDDLMKSLDDLMKSTDEMRKIGKELAERRWHEPFLANPVLITSGLCPLTIGLNGTAIPQQFCRVLGAGTMAGFGAHQAYKDYHNLLSSETCGERVRFGASIGLDAGVVSGGLLTMTRYGPKWLGPSVLMGSVLARGAMDLLPDKRR